MEDALKRGVEGRLNEHELIKLGKLRSKGNKS